MYRTYDNLSAFWWRSRLSEERKQEIINFMGSLDDNQVKMVEDMLSDARSQEYEEVTAEEGF